MVHYEKNDMLESEASDVEVVNVRRTMRLFVKKLQIGTWLPAPTNIANPAWPPIVGRGECPDRLTNEYIYRHEVTADTNYYGRLLAVQENTDPRNMEAFWMETGRHDMVWPAEMHRYTVTNAPAADPVYIFPTENECRGPKVDVSSNTIPYTLVFILNRTLGTNEFWQDANGLLHAAGPSNDIPKPRYVVTHYETTNGLFEGLELVQVRNYVSDVHHENLAVGEWLPTPTNIAHPAWPPHVGRDKRSERVADEYIYQHDVRRIRLRWQIARGPAKRSEPTNMEVFWIQNRSA